MNVLHVFAPAMFGGLERVVHLLAKGQHQSGHNVRVAALIEEGSREPPILASLRSDGVPVSAIVLPGRAYLAQRRRLRALIAEHGAEIVHTHGYLCDVLGLVSRGGAQAAFVSTTHGFTGGGRKNRFYEWLQRRALRRFEAVVAVSAKLGRELVAGGISAARVHVLPNAWGSEGPPLERAAARAALGVPANVFSIGWVGRVSREKGLDVLLDALPALGDLPFLLTVLGDGRERPSLEAEVVRLGLTGRVSFRGVVADAARVLPAFDVLVISSRTEGTPMALFEAMHAGVPIVSTAVGGIPDVVSAGEALLVPPTDPRSLASAIESVATNPVAASDRARRARQRLGSVYAIGPWVDAYDVIYRAARRGDG